MAIAPGDLIGPYQILASLGVGGMGEVFKARDTRLDRIVALKILSASIAGDPTARERFERETRAIAALNHPNICAIFDVGRHGAVDYFVMEYLEGETLSDRLARAPLPLTQAVECAASIAAALDRAHAAGLIHRDVKPGNVIVGKGVCKLLDFGIAKPMVGAVPDATTGAGRRDLTDRGLMVGTVQYMAPEQIEGGGIDARTDIFSLGAVLYEALTGRKAFEGSSQASVMAAILQHTPARVSAVQPLASPFLDHIVQRCLEKDPDRRWQSARDLMLELEAAPTMRLGSADATPRRRRTLVIAAFLAGAATAAGVLGWFAWPVDRSTPDDRRVVERVARVTHEVGFSQSPTWAPDGRVFAFASNRNGNFEIYVRRIEGGQEVNITNHSAEDVQPAVSPDGNSVAFVSTRTSRTGLVKVGTFMGFLSRTYGGDIWIAPVLGGQARRVATDGNIPAWHPDGESLIYLTGRENHRAILRVGISGNQITEVLPESSSSWEIIRLSYSPDGKWITFETDTREIFLMGADGALPRLLLTGSSHAWDAPARRIYYANQDDSGGSSIHAVDLSAEGNTLRVASTRVVGVSTGILTDLALARDGRTLLASGLEESFNLARLPLAADGGSTTGTEEMLSTGQVRDRYPAVSPDGRRIAVSSNRLSESALWIVELDGTRQWRRVELRSDAKVWVTQACWAGDQHLVVMRIFQDGMTDYEYIALDGSMSLPLVGPKPALAGNFGCHVSRDGKHVVYPHLVDGFNQLFVMDLSKKTVRQLTTSPLHKYDARWSPDGAWVAFSADSNPDVHVWRIPSGGGGPEQRLTSGAGRMRHLFYSSDGRWLYVQRDHGNIARIPVGGGEMRFVTRFDQPGLFIEEPTISPDGRWLVYIRGHGGSSIWALSIGDTNSQQ